MKQSLKYLFLLLFLSAQLIGLTQRKGVSVRPQTDTILVRLLKEIPKSEHVAFKKEYQKMSVAQRKSMLEMMEVFASMPRSSKKELIKNIDTNYSNILALKDFFSKLIPMDYDISIEFNPPQKVLRLGESIDIKVSKKAPKEEFILQQWNVELTSLKLDTLLKSTPLNREALQQLKSFLDRAHCISIRSGAPCEIGFARSNLGKYSYLLFDSQLTAEQQKEYNNGCSHLFYRDNIVLEYGGGAIGPQCFPDKD